MSASHLLSALIALPLCGTALLPLIRNAHRVRLVALIISLLELVLSSIAVLMVDPANHGFQ